MYKNFVFCAAFAMSCGLGPDLEAAGDTKDELPQSQAGGGGAPSCPADKVMVCHVPPGNPANAHTLCVGAPAVKAHVQHHGDALGPCGVPPSTPVIDPDPVQEPQDAGSPSWSPSVPDQPKELVCVAEGGACMGDLDCCQPGQCVQSTCIPLIP